MTTKNLFKKIFALLLFFSFSFTAMAGDLETRFEEVKAVLVEDIQNSITERSYRSGSSDLIPDLQSSGLNRSGIDSYKLFLKALAEAIEDGRVTNDISILKTNMKLAEMVFDYYMAEGRTASSSDLDKSFAKFLKAYGTLIYAMNEPFVDVNRRPSYHRSYEYLPPHFKVIEWVKWGFSELVTRDLGKAFGVLKFQGGFAVQVPKTLPFIGEDSRRSSALKSAAKDLQSYFKKTMEGDELSSSQKSMIAKALNDVADSFKDIEPERYAIANKVMKAVIASTGIFLALNPIEIWTGWTLTADSPIINSSVWASIYMLMYNARNVSTGTKALPIYRAIRAYAKKCSISANK